ncbi:MAG: hypothetical protein ABSD42_03835 [Candidatus Bathyarchaeia archaeon]
MTVNVDDVPLEFRKILTRIYKKPMSLVVIKGVPKSGKTDFALHIAEILKAMGLIKNFASNAETKGCDWIQYIDALNLLKAWGYNNRESKLFIFDEVIESTTNRRAMTDLNVGWVQYLPQISKAHMHILAIVQEEKGGKRYYESVFLDPVYIRGLWYKERRDMALFKSAFYEIEGFRLRNIPRTSVPFDKDTPAHFALTGLSDTKVLPRTLQVAILYAREGKNYKDIEHETGLHFDMEVKREIKKALNMFIKSMEGKPLEDWEEMEKQATPTEPTESEEPLNVVPAVQ